MMRRQRMVALALCALVACVAVAQGGNRLKVGLVLGGGGAKGACEVGVLKYIEQSGVPIDYIAGTSIGSIVGGLYAVGYRSEQIDTLFRSQPWLKMFAGEMLKGRNVVQLLDSLTGRRDSIDFDRLPIPFRCVAVDLWRQQEVVLRSGRLPVAMRASMAIPGVFRPVRMDSLTLVDGGMLNNLPVDVVKAMGADVVIAIDLTQRKHKSRDASRKERRGIGGLLDWLVSRPDWSKYNGNCEQADVYINPDLEGYGAASFTRDQIVEMIRIGEEVGRQALPALEQLRQRVYRGK